MGLQEALAYARSLARYAANLGPAAWKMASKKIEAVLPEGVQYGPGWVGDNGAPSQPLPISVEKQKSPVSDFSSSKLVTLPTSGLSEGMVEAVRKLNSQNEVARTQFPPQQNHMQQPHRNGFNGMFGYARAEHSAAEGASRPPPKVEIGSTNDCSSEQAKLPGCSNSVPPGYQTPQVKPSNSAGEAETRTSVKSPWPVQQQRYNLAVPPDLNVRVPVGSPNSSLQIGSPQQPDLALQL